MEPLGELFATYAPDFMACPPEQPQQQAPSQHAAPPSPPAGTGASAWPLPPGSALLQNEILSDKLATLSLRQDQLQTQIQQREQQLGQQSSLDLTGLSQDQLDEIKRVLNISDIESTQQAMLGNIQSPYDDNQQGRRQGRSVGGGRFWHA